MPLLITAAAVVLLIFLISKCKINTFISLVIVSTLAGIAFGIPLPKLPNTLEAGMGGTLGHIALIFGLGAMLGRVIADAGGAQKISMTLIDMFGEKKIQWAIVVASFIVGIALFFEVGLVLLIPIVFTISRQMKVAPIYLGFPMLASLLATHCFLPPHPGPTVIAGEYGADMGSVLMYGILIAIPTVIITGPIFTKLAKSYMPSVFEKAGDITGLGDPKFFTDEEMPGFGISILTAMLPVILMIFATVANITKDLGHVENPFILEVSNFLGNPSIAMLVSILFAIYALDLRRGKPIKEVMNSCSKAIASIGMMLLIIGGGGIFKQILITGGVGTYIASMFHGTSISPILFAWTVAAILRISLGSATVAALSTAGLVVPVLATTDANLALVTLATGAGSTIASHVNDAGFWMVKEYFGLSLKETFATWTVLSTIASVCGLVFVLVLDMFL